MRLLRLCSERSLALLLGTAWLANACNNSGDSNGRFDSGVIFRQDGSADVGAFRDVEAFRDVASKPALSDSDIAAIMIAANNGEIMQG